MADQGRWFKLWISSKDDPSLSLLPVADYGRWCKLGVYTKEHGTDGVVSLSKPSDETIAHPLQSLFQVPHFDAVIDVIRRLPNVEISTVSLVTFASVSFEVRWHNWWKYQGDFSTERVKRFREKQREMKRSKKRREEKRREVLPSSDSQVQNPQKESGPAKDSPAGPPKNGFSAWPEEWEPIRSRIRELPFLAKHKAWLEDLDWWKTLDDWFRSCPRSLDGLLTDAVAYIETEDYQPRGKVAIRRKLKNCMEFSARRAEREEQERKRGHRA